MLTRQGEPEEELLEDPAEFQADELEDPPLPAEPDVAVEAAVVDAEPPPLPPPAEFEPAVSAPKDFAMLSRLQALRIVYGNPSASELCGFKAASSSSTGA